MDPAPSDPGPRRAVAEVAATLLGAIANPFGPGLLLRGREFQPLLLADLEPNTPLHVAALGLLRQAQVADEAATLLSDHPDPEVRRAAALLGARAHPLRAGLEGPVSVVPAA